MKRIATTALAALTLMAPFATPQAASAHDWRRGDHDDRYDRDRDRDGRWRDDDRGRDRDRDWDRDDRWRGRGHDGRWDRNRHNGYNWQGRWYYGPPPQAYYGRYGYEPGYRAWRRGDRLPDYYRDSYRDVDWRYYRLRPPPRGCHYVRDDRGEILLVGIATGVILSAIFNNY